MDINCHTFDTSRNRKTYAAAFAIRELEFKRILFVVHRTQLAEQTKEKFENVYSKSKTMGLLSGNDKNYDKDFIFATIQTLSKDEYLKKFSKDAFDCIILDEAHHSSAFSYKKIMEYFQPKLYVECKCKCNFVNVNAI